MKNKSNEEIIILIPSLEPDKNLLSYVNKLIEHGFKNIIIVDDGSSEEYQFIFSQLILHGCVVLHHPKNLGKGCALKTGLRYIKKNYNQFASIVTVDSDGQHAIEDVIRIGNFSKDNPHLLTLGVRDFTTQDIPIKSLIGNKVASFVFYVLYGKRLEDTQTGLRAFGKVLLDFMLGIKGNRFEYEIQMLIACIQDGISIHPIPIQVIYENDNEGTHFKPLCDSISIIGTLFTNFIRFLSSSFICAIVDLGIAWFLFDYFKSFLHTKHLRILLSIAIARIFSIALNYIFNKNIIFHENKLGHQSLMRYLLLCAFIILLSTIGVYGLHNLFDINEKYAKIICDTFLFLLSYRVQQRWVFAKGEIKYDN